MSNPIAFITFMNREPNQYLSKSRKEHHLKLKDLAFILGIDQGNLSRFEAGKLSSPKALVGYHTLFNLSIQSSLGQVFDDGVKQLVDKCFQLSEIINEAPKTLKNRLRQEGLEVIITRLMNQQKDE